MNIQLIDVDSKIPNLALMKLSTYYKNQEYDVTLSKLPKGKSLFDLDDTPDIVCASVVFRKNKGNIKEHLKFCYPNSKIIIGGSGYSLTSKLNPKIEYQKPDYTLYPNMNYSMGYTSRGCNRLCHFCIVPKKEGKFKKHQHPSEFYNDKFNKIIFLDNNILLDKQWFQNVVTWCNELSLDVWFTQGLDVRIINNNDLKSLSEMNCSHMLEFAWDRLEDEKIIKEKIKLIANFFNLRQKIQFYVYVDSDKEFDNGLYRCKELKKHNVNAFLMFNQEAKRTRRILDLIRWVNRKKLFWSCDFEDYDRKGYK